MRNEVIIHVRAVNDTRPVFDTIRAEVHNFGDTVAVDVNKTITQRLEKEARAAASSGGSYARAGDEIGKTMGEHISERITEKIDVRVNERIRDSRGRFVGGNGRERIDVDTHNHETVHVDVDVNKQSFMQRIASFGNDIKDKVSGFFSGGITAGFSSVFSGGGDVSQLVKIGLITLVTTVIAPAIGAALTTGILLVLGGGAIATGILGALKDPRIQTGLNGLKEKLKTLFSDFSSNFVGPLEEVLFPSNKGGGGIIGVLDQITPMIKQLGAALGPIAGQLGEGLVGFLQNALPSIIRGVAAAGPIIQVLADRLPGLGEHIGKFFDRMAKGAPEARQFFDDLLRAIGAVIDALGGIVLGLTKMYRYARVAVLLVMGAFTEMARWIVTAADAALGWIPGWGPKLATAKKKVEEFEKGVNRSLDGIKDADITVYVHAAFDSVLGTARDAFALAFGKKKSGMGGRSAGGAVGMAATGGSRSGLTWVGERGPELIDAAPGSRVYSNADSSRMAGQTGSSGGGTIVVPVYLDGREIARAMADPQREYVRNNHGGNVQAAYGT